MERYRSISTPPRLSTSSRRLSAFSRQLSTPSQLSTPGRRATRDYDDDHLTPGYQRDTIASLAKQSPRRLCPSIEQRIRVLEAEIAILKNQRGFLATMIRQEKSDLLTVDEITSAAGKLGLLDKLEVVGSSGGDPEKNSNSSNNS